MGAETSPPARLRPDRRWSAARDFGGRLLASADRSGEGRVKFHVPMWESLGDWMIPATASREVSEVTTLDSRWRILLLRDRQLFYRTAQARASRFGRMARFSVLAAQRLSSKSNLI